MESRKYILRLALLAVAAFVLVRIVNGRAGSKAASPASSVAVAPQGQPADSAPSETPPMDLSAAQSASGEVTVEPSRDVAPSYDTASVAELIREGSPGTYFREFLAQQNNLRMRWPDRRHAMRVWIERDVQMRDWSATYPVAAERAFAEWQEAGFPLRFDMVRDPVEVDIQIRWVERFPASDGRRIGMARKKRDQYGWLVAAEITVATHDSAGAALSAETVHGTVRHEVGHALGLGHSSDMNDVMYPESATPVISVADRKTLHLLYLLPPGRMP